MSDAVAPEAPTPPSWPRLVAIVAIFAGLGPLVGLVTFASALAVRGMLAGRGMDSLYLVPFLLIYGLIFAHFVGGLSAASAGVAMAAIARWVGRVTGWMALAIGLASWLVMLCFSRGEVLMAEMTSDGIALEMLATHVVSTLACWRLAVAWAGLRR